jgi:hypothetical protein
MKPETRDFATLLAHQYDQPPSTTPNYLGQSPASPRQIDEVIHGPGGLSSKALRKFRREERRQGR